jgi:hypothetical protein
VLGEDRTSRRRLAEHAATIDSVLPLRTLAVRRWIRDPAGAMGGVLFLSASQSTTPRYRIRARTRGSAAR